MVVSSCSAMLAVVLFCSCYVSAALSMLYCNGEYFENTVLLRGPVVLNTEQQSVSVNMA